MGVLAEPRTKGRHIRAKWEAIKRTKETLGSQISTEGSDSSMGLGMARKVMESFGWKNGQGLGASNQGLAEPVKLHQNIDSRGVGYTAKRGVEQEHHAAHFQRFESVLAALSAANKKDKAAVDDTPDDSSDRAAGEVRPKRSRNHLHYHKFSRAKDVSQYSRHDLECVIGAKAHALYSDVLKEKEFESSDKFTVSELNTTEYFSSQREAMSSPPPAENTEVKPCFGAGPVVEEDTKKTEDIVQKNFEERMAKNYATCFVSSDSALALQTSTEEANRDNLEAVDIETHLKKSKKKKKKSKKNGNDLENGCSAVHGDGKVDVPENGPVMVEKENVPNPEMESATSSKPEDVQGANESNIIKVEDEEALSLPKKKKKKNRKKRNDSYCNDAYNTTSKTSEERSTGMDSSNSAQDKGEEVNKAVTTSEDSVNVSKVSVGLQGSALWSKYAQYYATSFVQGDTLPGSVENSAQVPNLVAADEPTSKKDRKKKFKRKDEPAVIDEAVKDPTVSDRMLLKNETDAPDAEFGDAAESVSKTDGESVDLRSSKKKRKNKVAEILDSCVDGTEPEGQNRSEIPQGNTAMDVDSNIVEGNSVPKKKKKGKLQDFEVCESIREREKISLATEKCKNDQDGVALCPSDVFETESNSFETSEKKKNKKRKKTQKVSTEGEENYCEEIIDDSCVILEDQQVSSHSKSKKKCKKAREDRAAPQAVVDETNLDQRNKSTADYTQASQEETSELKKKKKKKPSQSQEVVVLDDPENCISLGANDSGEKEKHSKKRKRQEADISEESNPASMEQDAEKKRKKKKQKYSDDA